MCKVAICIPCYEQKKMLERLLNSIEIQTFRDFIVIISDDSESIEIEELIKRYDDFKIFYHKNKERLGATKNTNFCMSLAERFKPLFIKVMHHDDYFSFNYSLYKMVHMLDMNENANIAFCGTYQVSENGKFSRAITKQQIGLLKEDVRILFIENSIGAPSATIIRNIGIKMDENLTWYVDIDWYIRILWQGAPFVFSLEPLVSIGLGEGQVTNSCLTNPELTFRESIYLYKKYFAEQINEYIEKVLKEAEHYLKMQKILEGCQSATEIYIYGAGVWGRNIERFLKNNDIAFKGFIVSNGCKKMDYLEGHPVFEIGEIESHLNSDSRIILAIKDECDAANVLKHLYGKIIYRIF